jgi:acetyl-CoA carboxylase biotin carboxylase subunit
MIQKLLIANRGEIAVRIIRACREMGIETVAVYSEADRDSLHTKLADEAVCIGPGPSTESYLNMERIISATLVSGADAVHPGFGFLSENARFARICEQCNITFVGPSSEVIQRLGDKQMARNTMIAAKVPVIPGTDTAICEVETGRKEARRIGYPVIIKAVLGGGGKGMRVARTEEEFSLAFQTAQKEAETSFGDGRMYIEHFVEHPRHIEFQILADSYGNVIHLGERDCSIQRNHQKMIEESPCTAISEELRKAMGQTAVQAAKAAGYVNAGTIEFLLERDGSYYFMEMNTRIQVEHPVTEWVTGMDLIKEQIRIASGMPLSVTQKEVQLQGHAIECRINAENPKKKFRPSPGVITGLHLPGGQGIRVDTAIYSGYRIPSYYDSMLVKLIVHGETREAALAKLQSALGEVIIEGIDTNVDYQFEILKDPDYRSGNFDIEFLNTHTIGGVRPDEA